MLLQPKNKAESKHLLLFYDALEDQASSRGGSNESAHWHLPLLPVPLALTLLQSSKSQTREGRPHRSPHYFSNNYHLLFSLVYEKLLNSLL